MDQLEQGKPNLELKLVPKNNIDGMDGASIAERLVEAARRDALELLDETLADTQDKALSINSATDPLGNHVLHIACANGSYDILDRLLDEPGVEVDPLNRLEGETPLHSAVRYSHEEPEHGAFLVETLIEAGADPRIRNKRQQNPRALVLDNPGLVQMLREAEIAISLGPQESAVKASDTGSSGSESE